MLRRVPWLRPLALTTVALAILAAGWLGYQAWQLQAALTQAKTSITDLADEVRTGPTPHALALLRSAQEQSQQARAVATDPVWRVAAHLPVIGDDLTLAAGLAFAVDDLARQALPDTLKGAQLLSALRRPAGSAAGSALDLGAFRSAAAPLRHSAEAVRGVQTRLRAMGELRAVPPLGAARQQLQDRVDTLATTLAGAATAAETVPTLLGDQRTQHYFLALQNNAESRGSGGLVAAFGLVAADKGTLTLTRTGVNDELRDPATAPLDLGPEFTERYGVTGADRSWLNANESPDFPTTGRILTSLWNATEAQPIDGVVALDPVALSYVLQATGPVTLTDGTAVTAANVVDLTMRGLYDRYPDDASTSGRTRFLQALVRRAFTQLTDRSGDPVALAERLGRAVLEGHLQVYSSDPALQQRLGTTRITGALPADTPNVLEVVTQNLAGGKLDYYLRRDITYAATDSGRVVNIGDGAGPQPEQAGDLTVTLHNTAPTTGLPAYVTKRADLPSGAPYLVGQNRLWVSVYLGRGARLATATLDGKPIAMSAERERGLGVFSTLVNIDPGKSVTLRLGLFQPTPSGAPLTYRSQPMVFADRVRLTGPP